jgi:hypothetical protein
MVANYPTRVAKSDTVLPFSPRQNQGPSKITPVFRPLSNKPVRSEKDAKNFDTRPIDPISFDDTAVPSYGFDEDSHWARIVRNRSHLSPILYAKSQQIEPLPWV